MNKQRFFIMAIILAVVVVLAFHPPAFARRMLESTDLVVRFGKRTFAGMLTHLSERPALANDSEWVLVAPDGSAEFVWRSFPESGTEYDAALRIPAEPFIAAGLDAEKLPKGIFQDGHLVFALPRASFPDGPSTAALDAESSFGRIMGAHRDRIAYHYQLGHYGIDMGGGNLLEWAADPRENALDLVFALEPTALERAGVDVNAVDGWTLGSVLVHEPGGRKVEVPKLLKPFDLPTD